MRGILEYGVAKFPKGGSLRAWLLNNPLGFDTPQVERHHVPGAGVS